MSVYRIALAVLLSTAPLPALAAGLPAVAQGVANTVTGALHIGGGSTAPTPGTPGSARGGGVIPTYSASDGSGTFSADSGDRLDERWGQPLDAGLYDSDTMHAGVSYYYDAGASGGQGGAVLSLTFKN